MLLFSFASLLPGLGSLFGGMGGFAKSMWRGFSGRADDTAPAMFGGTPTAPNLGMQVGSKMRTGLSSLGGALGSAVTGTLAGRLQKSMSPAPGDELRKQMNKAFPGTNPWERLGAGGGGLNAIQGTERMLRGNQALKGREMRNQKDIAMINARAHMGSSFGTAFPGAMNSIDSFIKTGKFGRQAQELPGTARSTRMQAGASVKNASTALSKLKFEIDKLPFERIATMSGQEVKRFGILLKDIEKVLGIRAMDKIWPGLGKTLGLETQLRGPAFLKALKESSGTILRRPGGGPPGRDVLKDRRDQGFSVPKFKVGIGPTRFKYKP